MTAFKDHFSAVAADYAKFRPTYPAALATTLAALAPARDLAWDVGCGSGQLSVDLAAHFTQVVATDPAAQQLAQAIRRPNLEYRQAPAEASGLPDASADLVVAAQAAHWFDWPRFVTEAARVARPGALIAVVMYNDMTLDPDLDAATAPYRDTVESSWHPERAIVRDNYAALVMPWPSVELPTPALTMTALWTRAQLAGYMATWSASTRYAATAGPAAFEALQDRLAVAWPGPQAREIRWPLTVKLARR